VVVKRSFNEIFKSRKFKSEICNRPAAAICLQTVFKAGNISKTNKYDNAELLSSLNRPLENTEQRKFSVNCGAAIPYGFGFWSPDVAIKAFVNC
jgi:hypothetical protein